MPRRKVLRRNRRRVASNDGPSANILQYTGPVHPRGMLTSKRCELRQLGTANAITTSAGGVINTIFSTDPSGVATHWSEMAAVWDEYRVLAIEVKYQPKDKYNFANNRTYVTVVLDMDDAGSALTSNAQAASYQSHKFHNLSDTWSAVLKCSGSNQLAFVSTAGSPDQVGSIKLYSDNNTASTVVGFHVWTWLVQFRSGY